MKHEASSEGTHSHLRTRTLQNGRWRSNAETKDLKEKEWEAQKTRKCEFERFINKGTKMKFITTFFES